MWEVDKLLTIRGAQFDASRRNRFTLWRRWAWPRPGRPDNLRSHLVVIGLNPSTATEDQDDPTIRRCIGFAKAWQRDGLVMLNLFPYRSTDPEEMKDAVAFMGSGVMATNDRAIVGVGQAVGRVLAAWGEHGVFRGRSDQVLELLGSAGVVVDCLSVNKSGQPKHPLYVAGHTRPVPYRDVARVTGVADA